MTYRHAVCFPSATIEQAKKCAWAWKEKGYIPVIMLDWCHPQVGEMISEFHSVYSCPWEIFPGYYKVIGHVCKTALEYSNVDLCTAIGDDMLPSEQGAQIHADLYFKRFPRGEGVMQCTGDRQGDIINGKFASERICGSPTFGKEWARKAFGGKGPFGDYGFKSFYCDEMLKCVAEKLGLLYQEPALSIHHAHWSWGWMQKQPYHERAQKNWDHDRELFDKLKAEGFPGHELLTEIF